MSVEQSLQAMKEDMREVKEALKEIKQVLGSFSERFVSNEKDLERMINEYIRINTDYRKEIDSVKSSIRDQDDLIWAEIRRCQEACKINHEKLELDCKEMIQLAKNEVKRDIKAWIAFAIVAAVSSVVYLVVSRMIHAGGSF